MTERRGAPRAAAVLACMAAWSLAGHAETLLVSTPLVQGSLATATAFSVPGAGVVTITLADLDWPTKLASLSFAATTPTAVLASLAGPGQTSFTTSAAGIYSAVVDAVASPSGLLDLGWFSLTINYTSSVPLPASVWLLLSSLGWLAAICRGKATALVIHASRGVPTVALPATRLT